MPDSLYYFRDSTGNEVDIISERDGEPMAIEIKSGLKLNSEMFRGLHYWLKYQPKSRGILIHGGKSHQVLNEKISVVPWTEVASM